jgi:hypothetical protein
MTVIINNEGKKTTRTDVVGIAFTHNHYWAELRFGDGSTQRYEAKDIEAIDYSTDDLRVWHIPQVPMKPFVVPVSSPAEGARIMALLAAYDLFQFENKVKPDFSNAQGLSIMVDGEMEDWYSDDQQDIDEAYGPLQEAFHRAINEATEKHKS